MFSIFIGPEGREFDKCGEVVELPPRPYKITPCAKKRYEPMTALKLLDATNMNEVTKESSMFQIPLVRSL